MKLHISFLTVLILMFCSCSVSAGGGKSKADILLSDSIVNFKGVKDNGPKVTREVTFTNTGKKPLVIEKVQTSCHCAQPSYSKEPVKPGKTGTISITVNPEEMFKGIFERTITVYSNAKRGPVRIRIKGHVE